MNYKKINNYAGWIVFIIASIVYLMTVEGTTSLWDCGEYITTANKLEVGHPPGAPFFMMLGRLFSAFSSPENAAYMVNVMSALSSSATILFLFWSLTMLAKKLTKGALDNGNIIAIIGTGAVGALAYTFTDSFWFSAVEGEVYAMSSFFTAIVFWAILKWEVEVDKYNSEGAIANGFRGNPNRWIIFIAYMIGLSIGVHLLNLLAIPAIAFVIYFKKYEFNIKSFLIAGITGLATLGVVQAIIIPKIPSIADAFERTFTNSMGLPFNTGSIFFFVLIASLLTYGIYFTAKKGKAMWNMIILSFTVLLIGYSSFTMIVVRSNANPPLDENNPETLSSLVSYLNRDQYGTWPILYGQYWNSPTYGDCNEEHLEAPKVANMKAFTIQSMDARVELPKSMTKKAISIISKLGLKAKAVASGGNDVLTIVGEELSFMNMYELEAYKEKIKQVNDELSQNNIALNLQTDSEIGKKYINTFEHRDKGDKKYVREFMTLFPRMYRQGEGANYMAWSNYEGDMNNPLPEDPRAATGSPDRAQQYQKLIQAGYTDAANSIAQEGLYKPTMGENIGFMMKYQFGWMYWRYFLWNFSGRQNDIQGYGLTGGNSEILEGNWISGIDMIDEQRLGSQQNLPSTQTTNTAYNKYYMLPLILGLIGFIFHVVKSPKDWFVVLLLFLLTGIAIVIYLNQKPAEPRERDYAYAASFYAFSIWVGLGVFALFHAAKNLKWKDLGVISGYCFGAGVLIYLLEFGFAGENTPSHAFSFTILYISLVGIALHVVMMLVGNSIQNNMSHALLATGLGLVVPFLLAKENWDDHDRSNRTTARDFAYNYLASCDENAILFTNGDNDTFPLWYIQDVEGVRTDVRVANMSLLSTDWHINQMKRKAYKSDPLPITLNEFDYRNGTRDYVIVDESEQKKGKWYSAKEAIAFIMNDQNMKNYPGMCNTESFIDFRGVYIPVDKEAAVKNGIITEEQASQMQDTLRWTLRGSALYKADLAVLDILANYKWDRGIYFASLGGIGASANLGKYMQAEGMAYKLTPIDFGAGGGTNTDKIYDLVMNGGFKWGNMKGEGVLVDYYSMRMVTNIRYQMYKFVNELIEKGESEKAIAVIDRVFEVMPIENLQVPLDDACYYLCASYYEAGDKEKGDALGKKLVQYALEEINYFLSLEEEYFNKVMNVWGKDLNQIEMLREASLKDLSQAEMIATDPTNSYFSQLGVLEGLGYEQALINSKAIFVHKMYEKQNFFANPQKFPSILIQYCWAKQ